MKLSISQALLTRLLALSRISRAQSTTFGFVRVCRGGVGFVDLASGEQSVSAMDRHPHALITIKAWAKTNAFDAAIWTALSSNFHETEKAGEPFSVEAA